MQSDSVKGAKLIRLYDISIHENALAITKAFLFKLFKAYSIFIPVPIFTFMLCLCMSLIMLTVSVK